MTLKQRDRIQLVATAAATLEELHRVKTGGLNPTDETAGRASVLRRRYHLLGGGDDLGAEPFHLHPLPGGLSPQGLERSRPSAPRRQATRAAVSHQGSGPHGETSRKARPFRPESRSLTESLYTSQ